MKYGTTNLGQIEALLNKIGGEEGMNAILSGKATITYKEHIIDLDADPRTPYDGWKIEEHKKGGQFAWNPAKVALFLSKKQQDGNSIEGDKLRKEMADQTVYNANLLDYLLDNPHLIPEEWKGKARQYSSGALSTATLATASACAASFGMVGTGCRTSAGSSTTSAVTTRLLLLQVSTLHSVTVISCDPLIFVLCSRQKCFGGFTNLHPCIFHTGVIFLC